MSTDDATEQTGAPAGAPADELERLRAELAAAQARADEHYRSWQRSAADFSNFKRRIDEEKRFVERWLLQELLPPMDDFERAWAALPRELLKLTWLEGVYQVYHKLGTVLERHGVERIEADEGMTFNPLEHEAVMHEEGDLAEQTVIAAELQRGYRLHDRVLRPSLVKVGRPKEQLSEPSSA